MLDEYIGTKVGRISPEAPVPVAHVQKNWSVPGGAANVARNLSCLGCNVSLIGMRGNDSAGDKLQHLLISQNIKTRLVQANNRITTTKTRIVAMNQQLLRLDNETITDVSIDTLETLWSYIETTIDNVDAVIISDYNKGIFRIFNAVDSLANRIINKCKSANIPVFVDPKGANWERYANASCVTPNTSEFLKITTCQTDDICRLEAHANTLMKKYNIQKILLTRSEKGMLLFQTNKSAVEIPTESREVVDVSGAGDTVISVVTACITQGMDWISAAKTANIAAGIVIGKSGTSPISISDLRMALLPFPSS